MQEDGKFEVKAKDDQLLANAIPISDFQTEEDDIPEPIDLAEPKEVKQPKISENVVGSNKIRTFQQDQLHKDNWARQTNADGTGATHCKTFFTKLRQDAINHLDDQINEWLDEHPEFEVKFTTSCVGKLVGKTSEDAVFMTVWV